ncbi:hypothetical protein RSAG8_08226, partial [Rhizoctonia solani AG-8 WAC10335]
MAICKICDLAGENKDEQKTQVTLSMLRPIMDLSLSPRTFAELGYPGLVDGCIKLMETVKISNKHAPFRYEYGYLCFRILAVALGVCLLQRAKLFDAAVARMRAEPETELLVVLSEEVSQLVHNLLSDDEGVERCDWMLGLRAPKRTFGPPQMPFTAGDGPMQLLDLFCSDQKNISKALNTTYFPGLSVVFCLCWRYVKLCDDHVTGELYLNYYPIADL